METLQDEQRDCRQCGASVRPHSRFCEACGATTGPAAERSCTICGAAASASARFCAECGRSLGGRETPAHAIWEQVQVRAAAVDWERVGRIALPIAALLLAGLVGFGLGRQNEKPAGS